MFETVLAVVFFVLGAILGAKYQKRVFAAEEAAKVEAQKLIDMAETAYKKRRKKKSDVEIS